MFLTRIFAKDAETFCQLTTRHKLIHQLVKLRHVQPLECSAAIIVSENPELPCNIAI